MWPLLMAQSAIAADPAAPILVLLERNDLEGARDKCTQKGAAASTDLALREACAEAHFPLAEAAGTVEAWGAFRTDWSGTTWADRALTIESDLALSDLGYAAAEADYQRVAATYAGTEAARMAHDRAATTAVDQIKDAAGARDVAARYPEVLADVLRGHLGAFVTARIDATGAHDVQVDPPVLAPTDVRWRWASRAPNGRVQPWDELARQALAAPLVEGGAAAWTGPMEGPLPRCALVDGGEIGVMLEASGGLSFLPGPWDPGCGPDAPAVVAVTSQADVVTFEGPWPIDLRVGAPALVASSRGPLLVRPSDGLVLASVGEGRTAVWPTDGAPPWVTTFPVEGGLPVPAFPPDARTEVPRLVARVWFGPPGGRVTGGSPPVAAWTDQTPAGAHALDAPAASSSTLKTLVAEVGLDGARLTVDKVWEIDLDGDASKDLVGLGVASGEPVAVVASRAGRRVWVVPLPAAAGTRKASAFEHDGHAYFVWTDGAARVVVRHDGRGYRVDTW